VSAKLVTAWTRDDASGAKAAEKLRSLGFQAVPRGGCAVAEVEVTSRVEMLVLRDRVRSAFGPDFSLEQASLDRRRETEELVVDMDAAAAKVSCTRVGLALPLTDALGQARGARAYYSAPAVALRRAIREAGLELDEEQVRIRIDAWRPLEPAIPPPSPSGAKDGDTYGEARDVS
jgi:hypothetical protein